MSKLRELSYPEVKKRLSKFGFRFYRQGKGSHELWVRDIDGIVIPVPHYRGKKIRKGTIRAIIREIGLSVEEFMEL
ncbi:MAG: type II toxin-antitoxin system HicA family toxin [Candidatus Cloacimonetes bacterium]|nr:type II toxin-antitoxin system HicA family toxin [Candidatus Cloacimonadota bacterium]